MTGYVKPNFRTGPSSPKTMLVKAIHKTWEHEFEDCVPEYTPTYGRATSDISGTNMQNTLSFNTKKTHQTIMAVTVSQL